MPPNVPIVEAHRESRENPHETSSMSPCKQYLGIEMEYEYRRTVPLYCVATYGNAESDRVVRCAVRHLHFNTRQNLSDIPGSTYMCTSSLRCSESAYKL